LLGLGQLTAYRSGTFGRCDSRSPRWLSKNLSKMTRIVKPHVQSCFDNAAFGIVSKCLAPLDPLKEHIIMRRAAYAPFEQLTKYQQTTELLGHLEIRFGGRVSRCHRGHNFSWLPQVASF
jgi:hypothetical protein